METITDGHACSTGLIGMARSWYADVRMNGETSNQDHKGLLYYLTHLLTQEDHQAADETIHLLDGVGFLAAYERDTDRVTIACEGLTFTDTINADEATAYLMAHPHIDKH